MKKKLTGKMILQRNPIRREDFSSETPYDRREDILKTLKHKHSHQNLYPTKLLFGYEEVRLQTNKSREFINTRPALQKNVERDLFY